MIISTNYAREGYKIDTYKLVDNKKWFIFTNVFLQSVETILVEFYLNHWFFRGIYRKIKKKMFLAKTKNRIAFLLLNVNKN